MSTGSIRFISVAGADSAGEKRARQKQVRSHVTSQHYRQKRARDEDEYGSKRETSRFNVRTAKAQPVPEVRAAVLALRPYDHSFLALSANSKRYIIGGTTIAFDESGEKGYLLDNVHPGSYLGQGVSDPFVALPLSLTSRMAKHLYYYVNILMREMHPSWTFALVRKKFGCRSFVNADELRLNAICVYASTSRALLTGDMAMHTIANELEAVDMRSASFDWLYFKGKTMQMVNARLSNAQESISDNTIGAICELILSETYTGNMSHVIIHVRGLRRLQELRQRNHDVPYHLESRIIESYIKAATISQSKPTFPFTLTFSKAISLTSTDHVMPALGSALIYKWPHISTKEDFVPILHEIVTTTRHTEAVLDSSSRFSDEDYHEFIHYQNLHIEYRLLDFDVESTVEKACRISCLLYVNTSLVRGYPPSAAIIQNLVNALFENLEILEDGQAAMTDTWAGCLDVLFWVLFIGAHCSRQQAHESFFVDGVSRIAALLRLDTWESARTLLSQYLFVDKIYQETLEMIWILNFE
ncbi:hypothetical protein HD806DRAFT_259855 [Xylariaceae sp. AK1471]|nr:hypothetical protein HD806DRAFT_259855 [Xylariaceae sp. AK1471]